MVGLACLGTQIFRQHDFQNLFTKHSKSGRQKVKRVEGSLWNQWKAKSERGGRMFVKFAYASKKNKIWVMKIERIKEKTKNQNIR